MTQNTIGIDQYGTIYRNLGKAPRKHLLKQLGYSTAKPMYIDKNDGSVVQVGYVIGGLWITLYNLTQWAKPFKV